MAVEKSAPAVDLEALKSKDNLSEAEIEALGKEAIAEAEGKPKTELSDEDKEIERIAAEQAAEAEKGDKSKEELEAEARAKEKDGEVTLTAEEIKAEEERILKAKEEELSVEDKTKKTELLKLRGDDLVKKAQAEIESYALKLNMSVDDAKKELESIGKIEEKYGKDSKQLAQAYLHLQKTLAKKDEEIKTVQEGVARASMPTVDSFISLVDKGQIVNPQTKQPLTRESMVEQYRKAEPDITGNMDDESVLKLASKAIVNNFTSMVEKQQSEVSSKAKEKRVSLLNSIPESDRKYIADDIKPLIDKYPDNQIMADGFSMQDVLWWVKGKHQEEILKEHGEKEYNRGLSEAKILGKKIGNVKGNAGGGSGSTKKNPLTDAQKNEALDMYESAEVSDETKYEWYMELNNIK